MERGVEEIKAINALLEPEKWCQKARDSFLIGYSMGGEDVARRRNQ